MSSITLHVAGMAGMGTAGLLYDLGADGKALALYFTDATYDMRYGTLLQW